MNIVDLIKKHWPDVKAAPGNVKDWYDSWRPFPKDLLKCTPIVLALHFGLNQDYGGGRGRGATVKLKPAKMSRDVIRNVWRWKDMINDVSEGDPHQAAVFSALIATESRGNPNAVSPSGCVGLTQICGSSGNKLEVENYDKFGGKCQLHNDKCYALVKNKRGQVIVDNRKEPYVAIQAGWKIYQNKRGTIRRCSKESEEMDRTMMLLAAYNGGEGLICDAARKSGKKPVQWADIYKESDYYHVKKHLGHLGYFKRGTGPNVSRIKGKVKEIRRYPYSVMSRYPIFKKAFEKKTRTNSRAPNVAKTSKKGSGLS